VIVSASSLGVYVSIHGMLNHFSPLLALLFNVFVCYSCLALKDLVDHTKPVVTALGSGDLSEARSTIQMVVGRDAQSLNEVGVVRAAVETLAENFVDGFLSPVFWYVMGSVVCLLAGWSPETTALCFMILFKVASTLDSMVGYKNEAFREMGWAGARFDDFMNFVPARLSFLILFLGAWISGLDPVEGMRRALKDRLKHDSPNAAHAESFIAGALHIRLGGPTRYPFGLKSKPWLGEGNPDPEPDHIQSTIRLLMCSAWISMAATVSVLMYLSSVSIQK